ncbi:UNVERIFIED_ORG: lipopolysaccharide export LptBFGC system permease protein LptF [Bacillus proteolyticus]
MELFEYYKKKGKLKCLIGTGLFLYGLIGMYNTWGNINWGPVILIIIASLVFFSIGFWQLRKGNLLEKNIVKNDLTFWDIGTYVLLELPSNNKHLGLYTPDGRYVAGTKMISSTLHCKKQKSFWIRSK